MLDVVASKAVSTMRRVRFSRFDQTIGSLSRPRRMHRGGRRSRFCSQRCSFLQRLQCSSSDRIGHRVEPPKNDQSIRLPPFKVLTVAGQPN